MTAVSVTKRVVLAFAFVSLLTGATISTGVPQPLPYTLQEIARSLPAPMPITREAVEVFLHTPLRHLRDTPSMRLYDVATPLMTRDGYIIKEIDVREAKSGSEGWRTDGRNFIALHLTFAATPCASVNLLQQLLDLPRSPTDLTGPEPGDFVIFGRYTSWGRYSSTPGMRSRIAWWIWAPALTHLRRTNPER
ncbi:hypothetical protein [Dyella caseinilytica]|uniref:Uncharacterized protein n=1 Tax=Dyella caseinilytica TaxID=1849581 RepID=A0ABX7GQL5_9GAMM|nr:hypothetical protein [Dyella caseinilytica]QRN52363.1 hypothetical protein ISN74_12815 [Dyella caseinilytica]GGA15094.1 hypothetical protein GCM10011408_41370 [Dyella caseinilytica]